MFAVCIEASHLRGMGHLFRALNLTAYFRQKNEPFVIFINQDPASLQILEEEKVPYEIVDFSDESSNWEATLIHKYRISVWLNDKFESSRALCTHVKQENILLAVIDDRGEGAELADLHFAGMMFGKRKEEIPGKHVYLGLDYNILNPEIAKYVRKREKLGKIIVTLGGSDTYGVTVKAVKLLKEHGYRADVLTGANFRHERELSEVIDEEDHVFHTVPSLMETFHEYDLAVTGGGVTALEANAAGLPCVIIANELHEIATGKYLAQMGGAVFAGYYKEIKENCFDLSGLSISHMSECALQHVNLQGSENIYRICKEWETL